MARKIPGIMKYRNGWRTFVRVNGKLYTKTWSANASIADMRDWIEKQKITYATRTSDDGTFAADVEAYLEKCAALASVDQRRQELTQWIKELGSDRARQSITTDDVSTVLSKWLLAGLSKNTVRHRRFALAGLFRRLDPKATNPVTDALRITEPKRESRGRDLATITAAINAMPDKRKRLGMPNLAKIRARVVASTGIPPGMIGKIAPYDLNLDARTVRLDSRQKGEGVEARTLDLSAAGVDAFRAFHQANAYGPFCVGAVNIAFKRGARRAGIDPRSIRLYDLRHSFLSHLYRETQDLATVAWFAMHAEGSPLTARYTSAARADVNRKAIAKLDAAAAAAAAEGTPGTAPAKKVTPQVTQMERKRA